MTCVEFVVMHVIYVGIEIVDLKCERELEVGCNCECEVDGIDGNV